jgi:putative polyhydroxyalkanoate system protein
MQQPIDVELPHKLGREEARRRIADNVHKLGEHIPGGVGDVQSAWNGDTLSLKVTAMGQTVDADVEVLDALVRCRMMLPGMLALFAKPIAAILTAKGSDLLLEDKSKD